MRKIALYLLDFTEIDLVLENRNEIIISALNAIFTLLKQK
jgi:hypothetical protein